MQRDVLIVGFGLAGWALTEVLKKQGISFVVFDPLETSSSKAATGIYNPVVLKRFRAVGQAKALMETSMPFYSQPQYVNFKHTMSIFRVFADAAEQNKWTIASDNTELSPYLVATTPTLNTHIKSPFGLGKVHHTGWINTVALLTVAQRMLESDGCFVSETFNYKALSVCSNGVSYRNWNATRVVFAEGVGVAHNPWFSKLPIIPNKGEWLIVSCKGLDLDNIVKGSVFIVPLGSDVYRVGATYERVFDHTLPSKTGKDWLVAQFKKVVDLPFEVLHHGAGLRPTTPDRKPIIGQHPNHDNLWCVNGLASRGVLWAPYLASLLVEVLKGTQTIPETLHVRRFFSSL